MRQTITETMFKDAFYTLRPDNFSYSALVELFEWYEEIEEEIGEPIELDVIAICCEWSEYTLEELESDYGYMVGTFTCPDCEQETSPFLATCEHCKEGIHSDDAPHTIEEWSEFLSDRTTAIIIDGYDAVKDEEFQSLLVMAF